MKSNPRRSASNQIQSHRRLVGKRLAVWPRLALTLLLITGTVPVGNLLCGRVAASQQHEQSGGAQLKIADSALQQMRALIEEKQSRSPEQRKIASRLLYASKMRRGLTIASGMTTLRTDVDRDQNGKTLVDVRVFNGLGVSDGLQSKLEGMGVEIVNVVDGHIRARMDLDLAEEIASLPEIISIREAEKFITWSSSKSSGLAQSSLRAGFESRASAVRSSLPSLLSRIGSAKSAGPHIAQEANAPAAINISEGDVAHRAGEARDFYGYTGSGIKIGVISDGVDPLASLQASGDLPQSVTVLPGQAGSGDEGAALMEIIYDLAPGAQLFFATADGGIANFAKNIRDLRFVHRCDIIVDDILYLAETIFQDGQAANVISPINGGLPFQAVKEVTADGALYFSSAGNSGNKNDGTSATWEGDYKPLSATNSLHDFGGSIFNRVTGANSIIFLQWSDPLGGSGNDYDMIVLNSSLTQIVDISVDVQDGNDDPLEAVVARAGEFVVVDKFEGSNRFLSIHAFGGAMAINTDGAIYGHNSAASAFAVGAVSARNVAGAGGVFNGTESVETFSSGGLRRFFYNGDGSPLTPGNISSTGGAVRQKPDICAADDVSTATPGFNPFRGTSAAAPHAAAIAALLLSAKRDLTPAQVRVALASTALDIEGAGVDRDSGAGIIMAMPAMQAIGAVPLPKITGASISGKKLFVEGRFFDDGAKILLDGEQQKTRNDETSPLTRLIAKKSGKKIAPGQSVTIEVRNASGLVSRAPLRFTKPAQ